MYMISLIHLLYKYKNTRGLSHVSYDYRAICFKIIYQCGDLQGGYFLSTGFIISAIIYIIQTEMPDSESIKEIINEVAMQAAIMAMLTFRETETGACPQQYKTSGKPKGRGMED